MELPYKLINNLDEKIKARWQKQFVNPGRASIDGIWRRTQCAENKIWLEK